MSGLHVGSVIFLRYTSQFLLVALVCIYMYKTVLLVIYLPVALVMYTSMYMENLKCLAYMYMYLYLRVRVRIISED